MCKLTHAHQYSFICSIHAIIFSRAVVSVRKSTFENVVCKMTISFSPWCVTYIPTFYSHGFTWILACISNFIHYKVLEEIIHPFSNINKRAFKVWKLISNFIPYFTGHVITYPCWNSSYSMIAKGPLVGEIQFTISSYADEPSFHLIPGIFLANAFFTWNMNWNKFCKIGIILQCMNFNIFFYIFLIIRRCHKKCIICANLKLLI